MKKRLTVGALALLCCLAWAPAAAGKTMAPGLARGGVTVGPQGGSPPLRYLAVSPGRGPENDLTIVERIDRDRGTIDRWWRLRGSWQLPAVAYDGSAGGLSANGRKLVLRRFSLRQESLPAPRVSSFAILDTALRLSHPLQPGQRRPAHAVSRVRLRGDFDLAAISPRGRTLYLTEYGAARDGGHLAWAFRIRAYDTRQRRLLPEPLGPSRHTMRGLPVSHVDGPGGWSYTLYDDGRGGVDPYLLALDTRNRHLDRVALPSLAHEHNPMMLRLRVSRDGHGLRIFALSSRLGQEPRSTPRLRLSIPPSERTTGIEDKPNRETAAAADGERFLAFAQTPRRPGNLLMRTGIAGRSAAGRPIRLKQYGDPNLEGSVLVFGCIHGTECAGRRVAPTSLGCPDPHSNVFVVPNLDPDGLAQGTRLNGRGVDLNRNFPVAWRPIGERGDPEYSGPHPFSEPETRLAARIVRGLRPEVTIWFHQHTGPRPLVRAWGQSAPEGRHFARLARIPFHLLPWLDGTAPNWQNHRFPGSRSFVVELPPGPLSAAMESRLDRALLRLARKLGED
jgi:protein MpaA